MKLYHGSQVLINDVAFCSETYFTDDIEVAKQYGNFIYEIDVSKDKIGAFEKDFLNEHHGNVSSK
ncbi:MAG: hypothetical protein AB7G87_08455 [Clostridia bacterium]